jgi:hypothetical protein
MVAAQALLHTKGVKLLSEAQKPNVRPSPPSFAPNRQHSKVLRQRPVPGSASMLWVIDFIKSSFYNDDAMALLPSDDCCFFLRPPSGPRCDILMEQVASPVPPLPGEAAQTFQSKAPGSGLGPCLARPGGLAAYLARSMFQCRTVDTTLAGLGLAPPLTRGPRRPLGPHQPGAAGGEQQHHEPHRPPRPRHPS